jgi:hypothetical protein
MKDQDSATILITFLLLLPWLGRAAVSAIELWRAHTESQTKQAKQIAHSREHRVQGLVAHQVSFALLVAKLKAQAAHRSITD